MAPLKEKRWNLLAAVALLVVMAMVLLVFKVRPD